jgi:hypothetical protein
MNQWLRNEPTLSDLFSVGADIIKESNFEYVKIKGNYQGKKYPTFFRLRNAEQKFTLKCGSKSSKKVYFETDARNDYFSRNRNPGKLFIENEDDSDLLRSTFLHNGICECTFRPRKNAKIGERYSINIIIKDKINGDNTFRSVVEIIIVEDEIKKGTISTYKPLDKTPLAQINFSRQKRSLNDGTGEKKGLSMPKIRWVYKNQDTWQKFNFNENSGLKIMTSPDGSLDVYINGENKFLKKEISLRKELQEILKEQYKISLTLACLGIYRQILVSNQNNINQNSENDLELVNKFSAGLSQVIIPIVRLGNKIGKREIIIPTITT